MPLTTLYLDFKSDEREDEQVFVNVGFCWDSKYPQQKRGAALWIDELEARCQGKPIELSDREYDKVIDLIIESGE